MQSSVCYPVLCVLPVWYDCLICVVWRCVTCVNCNATVTCVVWLLPEWCNWYLCGATITSGVVRLLPMWCVCYLWGMTVPVGCIFLLPVWCDCYLCGVTVTCMVWLLPVWCDCPRCGHWQPPPAARWPCDRPPAWQRPPRWFAALSGWRRHWAQSCCPAWRGWVPSASVAVWPPSWLPWRQTHIRHLALSCVLLDLASRAGNVVLHTYFSFMLGGWGVDGLTNCSLFFHLFIILYMYTNVVWHFQIIFLIFFSLFFPFSPDI